MYPILILLAHHRLHRHRPLHLPLEVEGRRRQADVAAEVADRLGQHPGRGQHLHGQPGAGDQDHRGRPAQGGRHRARRAAGDGRGGAPRAAAPREADRLPGDARQPGDARRPPRDHHRPHQVVRRRRRRRPVDEGDDALEGHLRGHELHRVRPRHRYPRPRDLRRAQRPDPGACSTASTRARSRR